MQALYTAVHGLSATVLITLRTEKLRLRNTMILAPGHTVSKYNLSGGLTPKSRQFPLHLLEYCYPSHSPVWHLRIWGLREVKSRGSERRCIRLPRTLACLL